MSHIDVKFCPIDLRHLPAKDQPEFFRHQEGEPGQD